jgi:hypothetical protein
MAVSMPALTRIAMSSKLSYLLIFFLFMPILVNLLN